MSKKAGFTLIELLVVIAIIALLMAIMMPALSRVKKQAKTSACLTKLKQWALYFTMYTEENNGYFMEGFNGVAGSMPDGSDNNRWVKAMGKYHKWESDIALCPSATKPWFYEDGTATGLRGTFLGSTSAWGYTKPSGWLKPFNGSYGINGWINNPDPGKHHSGKPEKDHWRSPRC